MPYREFTVGEVRGAGEAGVTRQWRRVPLEPEMEQLVTALHAEDEVLRSGGNFDAAAGEERRAQVEVDRIRNGIWRQHWAGLYAVAVYHE